MRMKFNLETPTENVLETVTRFSGWYIPTHGDRPHLRVRCNGKLEAALEWGSLRPDVCAAYPGDPQAIISGFQGDLLYGNDDRNREIDVAIVDESYQEGELFKRTYRIEPFNLQTMRPRSFEIFDLVVCSECHSPLSRTGQEMACVECGTCVPLRGETPHFLCEGGTPCLRLTERTSTHPYSSEVLEILDRNQDNLILDFGAGHTPQELLRPNVVYMDAVQYQWTDVVCTRLRLPFRDHSFSAVVSQAVFEHLPDPHHTAKELFRILRPGGIIHVDTAFMQPLHGDPWHFFNMTQHGLRQVMAPFEEIRSGVKSYQFPSAGLMMQFEAILPFLSSRKWRKQVKAWHTQCQQGAEELDRSLGEVGRKTLAAGFYFEGRRPH
jgi:SAM-dependent methyltransferase